jgi:DNA-binding response OmpR family regulator
MKILLLEDHTFFAKEIMDYIKMFIDQGNFTLHYASTYKEAEYLIGANQTFDYAILDVQLQNGRNGIEFADKNKNNIGKIMFITGCIEPEVLFTLEAKKYQYISKQSLLWVPLKKFLEQ